MTDYKCTKKHPPKGGYGTRAKKELTVRGEAGEAGEAGVVVRAAVGVGLVHGFIHHSCHPDGQVGGEGEHESTPVWRWEWRGG